jgi:dienelactone hydrolase
VIPTLGPEAVNFEDWLVLFEYDQEAPFGIEIVGSEMRGDVEVQDIRFNSPVRGTVKAYLVLPAGDGPHPGVVYLHWYEPEASTNNRTQFLEEAVSLAERGVASIMIDQFFPWKRPPGGGDFLRDRDAVVQQVLEVRRSLDILLAQPGIDPEHIALVGHDFGAMYGSLVAAIDLRVKAFVFIAGTGTFGDWFLKYWVSPSGTQRTEWIEGMSVVDPLNYIGHIQTPILFQFADTDNYVTTTTVEKLEAATTIDYELKWYSGGHEMNADTSRERVVWLLLFLGLV